MKIILLLSLLMTSQFASAADLFELSGGEKPIKAESNFGTIYKSLIDYPSGLKNIKEKEIVLISFAYNLNGELEIFQTNTSNQDLLKYVIDQLNSVKITETGMSQEKIYLKLTFLGA
jgi:hypothetical protein